MKSTEKAKLINAVNAKLRQTKHLDWQGCFERGDLR